MSDEQQVAVLDYPLGRLYSPDGRDYPMRAALPVGVAGSKRVSRHWTTTQVLDQERTNSCVGYAWKQFLYTTPLRTSDGPSGLGIYDCARLHDEWVDNDNADLGTSVRAGAICLLDKYGRLKSYVFAQSLNDVILWVLNKGPVVMGTLWHVGMFYPDQDGFVQPNGPIVGGHAWLLTGLDIRTGVATAVNSWGTAWGLGGKFKLRFDTLDYLLRERGEACAATEKLVKQLA